MKGAKVENDVLTINLNEVEWTETEYPPKKGEGVPLLKEKSCFRVEGVFVKLVRHKEWYPDDEREDSL